MSFAFFRLPAVCLPGGCFSVSPTRIATRGRCRRVPAIRMAGRPGAGKSSGRSLPARSPASRVASRCSNCGWSCWRRICAAITEEQHRPLSGRHPEPANSLSIPKPAGGSFPDHPTGDSLPAICQRPAFARAIQHISSGDRPSRSKIPAASVSPRPGRKLPPTPAKWATASPSDGSGWRYLPRRRKTLRPGFPAGRDWPDYQTGVAD